MKRNLMWAVERAATVRGMSTATVCAGRRRTWAEVLRRTRGLTAGLGALGLVSGDRVAVLMLNSDRHLETWFAIPGGAFVLTDLNHRLAPDELVFTVTDAGACVLIVDDAHIGLGCHIAAEVAAIEHLVYAGDGHTPDGMLAYEDLAATPPGPPLEIDEDELAAIFYTGGTSGLPKGAQLTHANLMANALQMCAAVHFTEDDVWLHAAPQFHLADGAGTYGITWQGGTHVFIPAFDPAATARAIQDERVTTTVLVPTMLTMMLATPGIEALDLSSLRLLLYGASPMPAEVQSRAAELLGCDFAQAYGMTELAPVATFLSPAAHRRGFGGEEPWASRLRSAGCPIAGVRLQVRLEDGVTEAKAGEVGEIYLSGANVMTGYWNRPEETAHALVDGGWYRSGDVAYADEDGYIFVVDRAKDMIISGGENVYSTEVENAIYRHPAVLEAAVIGIPHERWGETVHAEVVLRPDASLTSEELVAHCRTLIAGYKLPRSVVVRTEPLPKSGAGKILKRELRDPFWSGHERGVG